MFGVPKSSLVEHSNCIGVFLSSVEISGGISGIVMTLLLNCVGVVMWLVIKLADTAYYLSIGLCVDREDGIRPNRASNDLEIVFFMDFVFCFTPKCSYGLRKFP